MKVRCIALLALVPATLGSVFPVPKGLTNDLAVATVAGPVGNALNDTSTPVIDGRRRGRKKHRSTSSSSGERLTSGDVKDSGDSLGIESSGSSSSSSEKGLNIPSGRGWRKWHRQCTPCPGDMAKKWRDPSIKWICGGYQRARRSFKSECLMFYRNCQDGTMFVKLHDYRCDPTAPGYNGGRHFFYDYAVDLPGDTSGKTSETESTDTSDSFATGSEESDEYNIRK